MQVVLICFKLLNDLDKELDSVIFCLDFRVSNSLIHDFSKVVDVHQKVFQKINHIIYANAGQCLLYLTFLIWKNALFQKVDAVVQVNLYEKALVI